MDGLRQRLDALQARRSAQRERSPTDPAPAAPRPAAHPDYPAGLGGHEVGQPPDCCYRIERDVRKTCDRHALPLPPELQNPPGRDSFTLDGFDASSRLDRCVLIDIETGGFAGTEVFLVGLVLLGSWPLRTVQFLARDYPEEGALLRAAGAITANRDVWVSFNGKSFDAPFLRDRCVLHRAPWREPAQHIDLLHLARRRYRGVLPNCRLQTLEQELLGWRRVGDVPGCDIPDLFHHFVRTGNAGPLRPVIEHNQLDLISCAALLLRFASD